MDIESLKEIKGRGRAQGFQGTRLRPSIHLVTRDPLACKSGQSDTINVPKPIKLGNKDIILSRVHTIVRTKRDGTVRHASNLGCQIVLPSVGEEKNE